MNFIDDIFVGFRVVGIIVDVPSKRLEKRIGVFEAKLSLIVLAGFLGFELSLEAFDQVDDFFRSSGHCLMPWPHAAQRAETLREDLERGKQNH